MEWFPASQKSHTTEITEETEKMKILNDDSVGILNSLCTLCALWFHNFSTSYSTSSSRLLAEY